MFGVWWPSEASLLGTHVQVRVTNCVDCCDGSRGQESIRAAGGHLAAFNRRAQPNALADSHLAGPAKALTTTAWHVIGIAAVGIDL